MRNLAPLTVALALLKRDHRQAELIKQFCREQGKALRTGQYHAKNHTEAWQLFLERVQGSSVPAKVDPHGGVKDAGELEVMDLEPLYDKPRAELSVEERIEADQWQRYQYADQMVARHMEAGNEQMVGSWSRLSSEMLESWRKAKRDRERADELARKVVPVAEFEAYRVCVSQVAALVKNIGRELAAQVNPEKPHEALAVFERWFQTRWNPAIAELIDAA